jgi:D-alanyl-D-alanine carboxypeptidase (penicillin-binding protein 5/6)
MSVRPVPGSARHHPRSSIHRAIAVTVAVGTLVAGLCTVPSGRAAAATSSPEAIPPTGACPRTVTNLIDGRTTGPTPLPTATNDRGGGTLSGPGLQVNLAEGGRMPPEVAATAWMVTDLSTATVIASCNAHVPLAPASTLKILTALALAHELDWNDTYVGRPDAPATDGSKVGIVVGGTYSVRDLFHGLMLSSGNDAATALATVVGGMDRATGLMNTRAAELGALDTHAVNTSGLDAPGQVSSAYDLTLLGRELLRDPRLADLVTTKTYSFPGRPTESGTSSTFQIQNHNRLLTTFEGATGVKNGFTTAAGGSFVAAASRDGRSYLVTVLRAKGYTHTVAAELLDWAFGYGSAARAVGTVEIPRENPPDGRADTGYPADRDGGAAVPPARIAAVSATAVAVSIALFGALRLRGRRTRRR